MDEGFQEVEKKMGKANFSHLASQNILLLIVLIILIIFTLFFIYNSHFSAIAAPVLIGSCFYFYSLSNTRKRTMSDIEREEQPYINQWLNNIWLV